jgi:hypothetical protein
LPARKQFPVPILKEVGWAPEPDWALGSKEKSLAPAVNRTPAAQLICSFAIPTELSRLPKEEKYQEKTLHAKSLKWSRPIYFQIRIFYAFLIYPVRDTCSAQAAILGFIIVTICDG